MKQTISRPYRSRVQSSSSKIIAGRAGMTLGRPPHEITNIEFNSIRIMRLGLWPARIAALAVILATLPIISHLIREQQNPPTKRTLKISSSNHRGS